MRHEDMKEVLRFLLAYQLLFAVLGAGIVFLVYWSKRGELVATGVAIAVLIALLGVPEGLWMMDLANGDQLEKVCPEMLEHRGVLISGGGGAFFGGIAVFITSLCAPFKRPKMGSR